MSTIRTIRYGALPTLFAVLFLACGAEAPGGEATAQGESALYTVQYGAPDKTSGSTGIALASPQPTATAARGGISSSPPVSVSSCSVPDPSRCGSGGLGDPGSTFQGFVVKSKVEGAGCPDIPTPYGVWTASKNVDGTSDPLNGVQHVANCGLQPGSSNKAFFPPDQATGETFDFCVYNYIATPGDVQPGTEVSMAQALCGHAPASGLGIECGHVPQGSPVSANWCPGGITTDIMHGCDTCAQTGPLPPPPKR